MRRILPNSRDQRLVGATYLALAIALHIRPDVGSLIPYIEATTNFTPYSIAFIFAFAAGYLLRPGNLMLWKYAVSLVPMLVTCLYLAIYMLGNIQSSLLTGVIAFAYAVFLISNMQKQAVSRG